MFGGGDSAVSSEFGGESNCCKIETRGDRLSWYRQLIDGLCIETEEESKVGALQVKI